MQPKTPEEWPFIVNVIAPLAEWWRRHASVRQNLADLDAFRPDDLPAWRKTLG